MKIILAVLAAALVGFAVAYYWLGVQHDARLKRELAASQAAWEAEKQALEATLAAANNRPAEIRTLRVPATGGTTTNRISPQETLELLLQLKPGAGEENRSRVFRQIVHHLQTLVEAGSNSLPVIQQFLAQNRDVDYARDELNESGERVNRAFASRNPTRTDFLVPPSLRLGLVDVLEQMGTAGAERILAEMLSTTGRGVEVAYLARVLQELAPDKYREVALTAAKDLLTNLPAIDQPTRLDDNARAYLYEVLAIYKDNSFTSTAQAMVVTPEGHVDRQALNYLNTTLQEQAIPAISAAYKDPRMTNQIEKSSLLTLLLSYAGPNAEANQVFSELVANKEMPAGVRAYTIESLAGGPRLESPKDPQVIRDRMQLLLKMKPGVTDQRLTLAIDKTTQNLQRLLLAAEAPPAATVPQ